MKAYLMIELNLIDMEGFMEYAQRIPALISKHGGRYLVQGVEPTVVEKRGDVSQRAVLLEFPDRPAAEAFLDERSKSDLHGIWAKTTDSQILLVDGCV